ncbi:hypothetical protein OUZ56_019763 [Daphnia magna]|uniref:Uncharacterized protein n=1 Tax=Daphnia magna TaxID=35525 RepID=A0ABQ9ZCJ2_9CRUS|nr:hypothetical protein OUZ56_019763 [Daphnia magna]
MQFSYQTLGGKPRFPLISNRNPRKLRITPHVTVHCTCDGYRSSDYLSSSVLHDLKFIIRQDKVYDGERWLIYGTKKPHYRKLILKIVMRVKG